MFENIIADISGLGMPKVDRERDKREIRNKKQQEWLQSWCSQGGSKEAVC